MSCPGKGKLWLIVTHPDARTDSARIAARKLAPKSRWAWRLSMATSNGSAGGEGAATANARGSWNAGILSRTRRGEVTITATAVNKRGRTCAGSYPAAETN